MFRRCPQAPARNAPSSRNNEIDMSSQTVHNVGIIMNGVTGRMGLNQHLRRSIQAIIAQGGVKVGDEMIMPRPILVGRNATKLEEISKECGGLPFTTNLD